MGRYRAPAPTQSPYITESGMDHLKREEKALWIRRRAVVSALAAAAAEGDRSENAEYIYRKKELAGIDRRIRYLQKRLPTLKVAGKRPAAGYENKVFFGAIVTLEDEQGNQQIHRIVGPDEFDQAKQNISVDSPMARSLLKRDLDDAVSVQTPGGTREYIITAIDYVE